MDNKSRNLELEAWLIETTGEEMMANHLGPNWNKFDEEFGFYPNMGMTVADLVWQHQQAKVEELQKRVDAAAKLIGDYRAVNTHELLTWSCHVFADSLERALKGEESE
ncbi:hypothetical protein [Acinetobacter baumannii]|uniref:hypothetical protein n=1 Tax=Acinetobacter baumannii TaxID=470 RepID=UPI001F2F0E6C|nr:hypothetical protein [Acinetobacter baumannii]MDO7394663.1 hypothetical protein [Acinetobacter baumannii]UJX48819.1 hypothetical protein HUF98_03605 [Acinetobacter baumannii]